MGRSMAPRSGKRIAGFVLCAAAVGVAAAGWTWAAPRGAASTDNAYVRGEITALAPKVAGYVRTVEVDDNQDVRAGDVLFRIDDRDHRARLAQAVANVAAAEARLADVDAETRLQDSMIRQAVAQRRSVVAEVQLTRTTSARHRDLIGSSAISQALVDESDAAQSRAEAGLSAASAGVDAQHQRLALLAAQREAAAAALAQARATRDLARIDLEHTVVRAPVSGVVGNRQVRVGRLVSPGAPMLDIVPVRGVWVVANFKETQLRHIRTGQRARVTVDGYPAQPIAGVVDSFAPGSGSAFALLPADNATGNFVRVVQRVPVKIRLLGNPLPGRIVPGLSARVEIDDGDRS